MFNMRNLLTVTVVVALLVLSTGCGDVVEPAPEPSPQPSEPYEPPGPEPQPTQAFQALSESISGINTSGPNALAELITVSKEIDAAGGDISPEEGENLSEDMVTEFSDFVRNQVDAIDPSDLSALNDFFKLQRVQKLDEYGKYCDQQTRQYKEDQMTEKFNDYIRNWVDQIDPDSPQGLKDIFFLQKIQMCGKYDMATTETDRYKHEQMGNKFNEWVRNFVDNIDPSDPDSVADMVWIQKLQLSKKWEEYATADTAQYKHEQLEDKFNEWVRERVDELDPSDPDFEDDLEKLRVLQKIEKYRELVRPETHEYKEQQLADKMSDYVLEKLDNIIPGILQGLDELVDLIFTDIYHDFCPGQVKDYVEEDLWAKYVTEPGEPPKLAGTLPEHSETGIDPGNPIIMVFDQPMEPASVVENLEIFPGIDAGVAILEGNFIFVLVPLQPLELNQTFTMFLGPGAQSESGFFLEEGYEFSFKTRDSEGEPRVTETLPPEGQIDVPVGQPVKIGFDQPMNTTSVEAATSISPSVDCLFYWQQNNTLMVIQPVISMDFNTTYSVEIGPGAKSADGLFLDNAFELQFITGLVPAPEVADTLPFNGQEDIPGVYPILIAFSWPMDPDSVEEALLISPDFEYDLEWSEANFVMEIIPLMDPESDVLQGLTEYNITIDQGARSTDGLPLEESYSFTFTTAG